MIGSILTVYDNVTGLTWQRSPATAGDGKPNASDKRTFAPAKVRLAGSKVPA
jgi:hypothetical protein